MTAKKPLALAVARYTIFSRMLKKAEIPGFILRQAQDERERFQWLAPHGELVEP
jgi:hypothetical protein